MGNKLISPEYLIDTVKEFNRSAFTTQSQRNEINEKLIFGWIAAKSQSAEGWEEIKEFKKEFSKFNKEQKIKDIHNKRGELLLKKLSKFGIKHKTNFRTNKAISDLTISQMAELVVALVDSDANFFQGKKELDAYKIVINYQNHSEPQVSGAIELVRERFSEIMSPVID